MRFLKNRVLSVVCALSILFSLCVAPAHAASSGIGSTDALDGDSVSAWNAVVKNPVVDFVGALASKFNVSADADAVFWAFVDSAVASSGVGEMSYDDLCIIASRFNSIFSTRDAEGIFSYF